MPNVIVIAGANGAGKSTLAPFLLRDTFGIMEYVNADTIAAGLSAFAPEDSAFDAGKVMLARLNQLSAQKKDFAFETTLSGRIYVNWLKKRQAEDYNFHLVFLRLHSSELAVERVKSRIRRADIRFLMRSFIGAMTKDCKTFSVYTNRSPTAGEFMSHRRCLHLLLRAQKLVK